MSEGKFGGEKRQFRDTREIIHPGVSVAMDKPSTQFPENFIFCDDSSRLVVSSSDISFHAGSYERDRIIDEFITARDGRAETEMFQLASKLDMTPQPGRAAPMKVHAVVFDEIELGSRQYQVSVARAKTPTQRTTFLTMQQYQEGTVSHDSFLEPIARSIAEFSTSLDEMKFYVQNHRAGSLEPIDISSMLERVSALDVHDDRYPVADEFQMHNARLMSLANLMHGEFMRVNQIPGVTLAVHQTDDGWAGAYRSTLKLYDDEHIVGAMTTPLRSPMDAINILNTDAFLENPSDPKYPFTPDHIDVLVEVAHENASANYDEGRTHVVDLDPAIVERLRALGDPAEVLGKMVARYLTEVDVETILENVMRSTKAQIAEDEKDKQAKR